MSFVGEGSSRYILADLTVDPRLVGDGHVDRELTASWGRAFPSRPPPVIVLSAAEAVVGLVARDRGAGADRPVGRVDAAALQRKPALRAEAVRGDDAVGQASGSPGGMPGAAVRDAAAEVRSRRRRTASAPGAPVARRRVRDDDRPLQRQVGAEHRDPAAERDRAARCLSTRRLFCATRLSRIVTGASISMPPPSPPASPRRSSPRCCRVS